MQLPLFPEIPNTSLTLITVYPRIFSTASIMTISFVVFQDELLSFTAIFNSFSHFLWQGD